MRKGSPDSSSSARGEAGVPGEHCRPGTEPVLQGAWEPPPAVRPADALVTGTVTRGRPHKAVLLRERVLCGSESTEQQEQWKLQLETDPGGAP